MLLHLGDRFVVIGRFVDADPQLREVRADDFVGHLGAADVRAEIPHAWHVHHFVRWLAA